MSVSIRSCCAVAFFRFFAIQTKHFCKTSLLCLGAVTRASVQKNDKNVDDEEPREVEQEPGCWWWEQQRSAATVWNRGGGGGGGQRRKKRWREGRVGVHLLRGCGACRTRESHWQLPELFDGLQQRLNLCCDVKIKCVDSMINSLRYLHGYISNCVQPLQF